MPARTASLRADFTEKEGFDLRDTVTTPWRVLIVAEDLNRLVNTDIVTNLSPAPDPALFADTSWIRPGRSLWSWWERHRRPLHDRRGRTAVIDLAADMGYEYSTLDEGWEDLADKWKTLREIADYAAGKGVGLFVWRHWEKLNDPAEDYRQMRSFMDSIADCGVKGLKIDFMNGEGLRQIRFTTAVLENAARRRLLINFHGCQKPSGEIRTYPNELTREGVRGMELNRITANYLSRMRAAGTPVADRPHVPGNENQNIPAFHNTALPFTRCVAGPADYTPVGFSMPGDVLPVQQLACACLITSPLMTLAENPFYLLREERLHPALEFLRELPVCWNETVVLPQSRVGQPGRLRPPQQRDVVPGHRGRRSRAGDIQVRLSHRRELYDGPARRGRQRGIPPHRTARRSRRIDSTRPAPKRRGRRPLHPPITKKRLQ